MARRAPLQVRMYGQPVAEINERGNRLVLQYTPEALDTYERGFPLLSVAMPVRAAAYPDARPFLNGLLPEGAARQMLAYDFGVAVDDDFGLLREIGRECAGAVSIVAAGQATSSPDESIAPSLGEIEEKLQNLRVAPLGADNQIRVSLAGMQEKLLLTRLSNGRWTLPTLDVPSTHIFKPPHPILPHSVANEAFCMKLAKMVDLAVAQVDVLTMAAYPVLVVQRFDRTDRGERIHQEDMAQALSWRIDPQSLRKYEATGGPSFRQVAGVVEKWGGGEVQSLFDLMVFNVVIGNADAHAKNFSLLHGRDGKIGLAPAYDLLSTLVYDPQRIPLLTGRAVATTMAMFVDGVRDIQQVGLNNLVHEGMSWGMAGPQCMERFERLLDRLGTAVGRVQVADIPEPLVEMVEQRISGWQHELDPKAIGSLSPGAF